MSATNLIAINNKEFSEQEIARALHCYNKRKEYRSNFQKKNRVERNSYQIEYMNKMKEDKNSEQYKRRLENQRRYYNEVFKLKRGENKKEAEKAEAEKTKLEPENP